MKTTASVIKATLRILLGIVAISAGNGAFAQNGSIILYSGQDMPRDQDIQEGKITEGKDCRGERHLPKWLPVQSSPHYTLLTPQAQGIIQTRWVSELSGTTPKPTTNIFLTRELPLAYLPKDHRPALTWETGSDKSYLIPAIEIVAFVLALNGVARLIYPHEIDQGRKAYGTNPSTFWHNLAHGGWVIDSDDFVINQIRHPYQGSIYQGLARSAGLDFWESTAYTFLGSFLWETAGETTSPSINDQVASGIGGVFLGETLFRMANHILETGERSFWREFAAAIISPPTAFNRNVFGNRFKSIFPSYGPATFSRGSVGANWVFHTSGGDSDDFEHNGAVANFVMMYGLPGKQGYNYTRPFDYFEFEITAITNRVHPFDPVENLTTRGLLVGTDYEGGNSYRGIWGLYGSFDYIARDSFRVSTTALSLGTTGQWWLSRSVALQGSALAGLGYGAGGRAPSRGNRDYHYGLTEQGLLSLRLIMGDIAMLEATSRGYYISDVAASTPAGREFIQHLDTGLTVRIHGRNAVSIRYLLSTRDGDYTGRPTQHQKMETFALLYTILSDTRFGAVEWRETR